MTDDERGSKQKFVKAVDRLQQSIVEQQRRPDTLRGRLMDWWDPRPRHRSIPHTRDDGTVTATHVDRWPLVRRAWDPVARFVARHWQFTIYSAIGLAGLVVAILSYQQLQS